MIFGNIDAPITNDPQDVTKDLTPNDPVTKDAPQIQSNSPYEIGPAPEDEGQGIFQSIGTRFTAARQFQATIGNKRGRENVLDDQLSHQYAVMRENNVVPSDLVFKQQTELGKGGFHQDMEDYIRENSDHMDELKKQFPNAGFQNYEDIQEKTIQTFADVMNQYEAANRNTTSIGILGEIGGGAVGFMQDPQNAAVAIGAGVVGAAAGTLGAAGTVATMGLIGLTEAVGNIFLEVENKPGEVKVRRALGENLTDDQALEESILNVTMATGLAMGIGGAIKLLPKLKKGSPEHKALSEAIEDAEDARQMVGEPEPGVTPKDHYAAVDKRYAEVINDVETPTDTATPIKYDPKTDTTIVREADGTVNTRPGKYDGTELDLEGVATKKILEEQADMTLGQKRFEALYQEVSQPGKDVVTKSVDEFGTETQYSLKSELDEIKQDKTAHELVTKCLSGVLGDVV